MIRFLAPGLPDDPLLPDTESAHCVRVLRHSKGDIIEVTDGASNLYSCRIVDDNPRGVLMEIVEVNSVPNPWNGHVTIAVAPTKNADRMEWMLEKMTEIGLDCFVPLRTSRSERKDIKIERLEKIVAAAVKQSLKTVIPEIRPVTDFKSFVSSIGPDTDKFIAWCEDHSEKRDLCSLMKPDREVVVLIGPEGDFTQEEADFAMEHGFVPVTLGKCRLRTETAGLVALDTFHLLDRQQNNN